MLLTITVVSALRRIQVVDLDMAAALVCHALSTMNRADSCRIVRAYRHRLECEPLDLGEVETTA